MAQKLVRANATAGVHHASWRRGRKTAGRARAGAGETSYGRVLGREHVFELEPMDRRLCAAAARAWLDRGSHGRDRVSLGGGTQRAFAEFAAEFVRLKVDVILDSGKRGHPAKQATSAIPIFLRSQRTRSERPCRDLRAAGRQRDRSLDPVDRSCRQNGSNSCARCFPISVGWRSSPTSAIAASLEVGEVRGGGRKLGVDVQLLESGAPRTSCPRSARSAAARRRFMCVPTRW